MKLVLATFNRDKGRELASLLDLPGVETVGLWEFPDAVSPEETGTTLLENATLKAEAALRVSGLPAVADDTGLEVEALDGAPGVHAARFAGPGATHDDNVRLLLERLRGVPEERRRARFRTACVALFPDGRRLAAEGALEGRIAMVPRGGNGFGYDPVFELPVLGKTLAELTDEEKNTASHRSRAVRALAAQLADRDAKPEAEDRLAAALRGFGPPGILAILVILSGNLLFAPLSAVLVLAWARLSRTPWREIGFVRPRSWFRVLALGIVFGVAFKLLMKAVVMPFLGAPPTNQAYHFLVGNTAAIPGMLWSVIVGAGFGEETLFRGFLFERLGKLLGRGMGAAILIVLLSSVFFGVVHYPVQGLPGAQQATIFGLLFGAIYARTRSLSMLMVAHAAFDVAAVAIIYWDLETRVAQLFFR